MVSEWINRIIGPDIIIKLYDLRMSFFFSQSPKSWPLLSILLEKECRYIPKKGAEKITWLVQHYVSWHSEHKQIKKPKHLPSIYGHNAGTLQTIQIWQRLLVIIINVAIKITHFNCHSILQLLIVPTALGWK